MHFRNSFTRYIKKKKITPIHKSIFFIFVYITLYSNITEGLIFLQWILLGNENNDIKQERNKCKGFWEMVCSVNIYTRCKFHQTALKVFNFGNIEFATFNARLIWCWPSVCPLSPAGRPHPFLIDLKPPSYLWPYWVM